MSKPKIAAVLGGGISGLSAAYYIRKKFGNAVLPVIFEKTSRCGGWLESVKHQDIFYDTGPRSFRPVGLSGLNTLDLVEEIGIEDKVLYVPRSHPASKNRCIFTKGQMVRLPTDLSVLFKTTPPFERPLIRAVIKDLFTFRHKKDDDSIYNFIERRFGSDVAAYAIDPLTRGICAGDARKISVNLVLAKQFEYEKKYGSVTLGFLMSKLVDTKYNVDKFVEIPGYQGIGMSSISITSIKEAWALWGLENGTETLVKKLEEVLKNDMNVPIIKDAKVNFIEFPDIEGNHTSIINYTKENRVEESYHCDFVISALPSWIIGDIILRSTPSFPSLSKLLESITGEDVIVTNVLYRDRYILAEEGFGLLVPSNEVKNTPGIEGLLGIVFDTCIFDQGDNTIFTVLSKFDQNDIDSPRSTAEIEKITKNYLKTTLGITREPDHMNIKFSELCIPQYTVGHSEKTDAAKRFIKAAKLPLMLSGASFEGISVNDCIYSGRRASENLPF